MAKHPVPTENRLNMHILQSKRPGKVQDVLSGTLPILQVKWYSIQLCQTLYICVTLGQRFLQCVDSEILACRSVVAESALTSVESGFNYKVLAASLMLSLYFSALKSQHLLLKRYAILHLPKTCYTRMLSVLDRNGFFFSNWMSMFLVSHSPTK